MSFFSASNSFFKSDISESLLSSEIGLNEIPQKVQNFESSDIDLLHLLHIILHLNKLSNVLSNFDRALHVLIEFYF